MRPDSRLAPVLVIGALACGVSPVPTVAIQAPADGALVSGRQVQLLATTTPPTGVEQVEFIVDSMSVGVAQAAPFSIIWDSSAFSGRHVSVTAKARTSSGGIAVSAPIRVGVELATEPLSLGIESMYTLVNDGSLKIANEMVQDIWDLGSRSTPIYLNPENSDQTSPDFMWTKDPFDRYWRLLFYSLRPTSNLLWAYYTVGDPIYRDKLLEILRSFAAYDLSRPANALTFDHNYTAAFRAMVLVNTYEKLKRSGDLPADLDANLRCSIYKLGVNMASTRGFPGFFGNHAFTSAAALLLLAKNFPEMDDGSGIPDPKLCPVSPEINQAHGLPWKEIAGLRLYTLTTSTAVDGDGVEVENSPFYHLYVMTFVQQIVDWSHLWAAADVFVTSPFSDFFPAAAKMSDYAAYIFQPDGNLPLLGSTVAASLSYLTPSFTAEVSAVDPVFAYVVSQGASGTEPTIRSRLYPISGDSVLRSGFGPPSEFQQQTFITFNVGPWRSDHNHLDVLGLTYYSAGRILLPDSGLFAYAPVQVDPTDEGAPDPTPVTDPYHDFFWSTRAHNTVEVDGRDQNQLPFVQEGLTASGPAWAYQSGRDQINGVNPRVSHRRAVLLLQRDLTLVIDHLAPSDAVERLGFPAPVATLYHRYVQNWHFAPDLTVALDGFDAEAIDGTGTPVLSLAQAVQPNLSVSSISGAVAPIQGWYSEKYGVKVPNAVLGYLQRSISGVSYATLLASGPFAGTKPQLHVDQDDEAVVRVRACAGAVQYQVEIDNLANGTGAGLPPEAVQVTPITTGCN